MLGPKRVVPRSADPRWRDHDVVSRAGLAALLLVSGILHLVAPAPYRRIVPRLLAFGHTNEIVWITGLAELGCAASIIGPRTRRAGAWATMALFVAVFPANLKMAFDVGLPRGGRQWARAVLVWLRLPLQVPLILWARSVGADPAMKLVD